MGAVVDGDRRPTGRPPRQAASARSRSVPAATRRAEGIAPFASSSRKTAASRINCRSRACSVRSTPAAASAGSSPLLWPATASGRSPSRVSTWKIAHWDESTAVTAVSVAQSASGTGPGAAEEVLARGHLLARFAGDPVGRVEHGAELGEVRAEVGQHARILRAFAGEEERERSLPGPGAPPRSRARGHRGPGRQEGSRSRGSIASRCADQLGLRSGHDAQPGRPCRPGSPVLSVKARSLSEWRRPAVRAVAQPSHTVGEARAIVGRQEEGLACPSPGCAPGVTPSAEAACSSRTAWALIPAKPKALTPGAAGIAGSPWIQGRAAGRAAPGRCRRAAGRAVRTAGRREEPMVQRQGRLDQAGHARRRAWRGRSGKRRRPARESRASAAGRRDAARRSSARSAAGTPSPCPSMSPTVAGSIPEAR